MTQAAVTGSRSGAYIIGFGVQTAKGTAASTYNYVRWLDGTEANINPNTQFVYEGDGSNQYLLAYKKGQWWEWTCKFQPRGHEGLVVPFPIFGAGSDQGTGAAVGTYTASGAAPYQHVAALQNAMQYITVKTQFTPVGGTNNGVGVMTLVDACIAKLKISGKMGEPIVYEMSGYAVGVDVFSQSAISSPTYDTTTQPGYFYNAIYTPNSHVVGTDAANIAIQDFEIDIDRHVNPEDMLTTLINPQGLLFTQTETTCNYTLLWQDWTDFWQAYTNSTSVPTNLDQIVPIGSGKFQVNLTYLLPGSTSASNYQVIWTAQNLAYLEGKLTPNISNKPLAIKFSGKCLRNLSGAAQSAGVPNGQDGIAFIGTDNTLSTAIC